MHPMRLMPCVIRCVVVLSYFMSFSFDRAANLQARPHIH
jgi:hypothetical protein